jgi:methionyl aminopeptidase
MALVKTDKEIEALREGGKRLAMVREAVAALIKPGIRTDELDALGEKLIRDGGDEPAFKGYTPSGAERPYPATVCVSVNDEIVHGIPTENPRTLEEGDIVGIDLGLVHDGLITDTAMTVPVGNIDTKIQTLIEVTKKSLYVGIDAALVGNRVGDIGHAIETFVDGRYGIVRELGGHGVGHKVHEEPHVPNFGKPGKGIRLEEGMVLALEPMLNIGSHEIFLNPDGYTFQTKDGKKSAHFEHTILIAENGPEILTEL